MKFLAVAFIGVLSLSLVAAQTNCPNQISIPDQSSGQVKTLEWSIQNDQWSQCWCFTPSSNDVCIAWTATGKWAVNGDPISFSICPHGGRCPDSPSCYDVQNPTILNGTNPTASGKTPPSQKVVAGTPAFISVYTKNYGAASDPQLSISLSQFECSNWTPSPSPGATPPGKKKGVTNGIAALLFFIGAFLGIPAGGFAVVYFLKKRGVISGSEPLLGAASQAPSVTSA